MAIDLTGLFLTDAQVILQGDGIKVLTQRQDCIEDLLALPSPIWVYKVNQGCVLITAHNTDPIALAERICSTWEQRGCRVERLIVPLHSIDRRNVQSFILA